jgi:hypothetical protein
MSLAPTEKDPHWGAGGEGGRVYGARTSLVANPPRMSGSERCLSILRTTSHDSRSCFHNIAYSRIALLGITAERGRSSLSDKHRAV